MKYNKLEKMNKEISMLGLGCMRLPEKEDQTIDIEATKEMVKYAFENGLNYVDTAYFYHKGQSESAMGEVLSDYDRESFYLSTKMPLWMADTEDDVERIFLDQLDRLQTDYIDFYFMHAMNSKRIQQMKDWNVIEKLEKWKAEGKIKHIGFSFHGKYEEFIELLDFYDWEFSLIQLNYIDTDHQQGLQGLFDLEERGIPAFIMEPLKGGNLANFSEDIEVHLKEKEPNKSIASWAVRWLGSFDNVKVVLSGMSSLDNMKDNVDTCTDFKPLDQEESLLVDKVAKEIKSRLEIDCTGCNYCLPCPFNVNIPKAFNTYNDYRMYGREKYLDWAYGLLIRDKNGPEFCTECGICLDKCPQSLDIPELLKKVETINPRKENGGV
jgi:predicted aldo/keto reductase-like oxidoreductase